ncbi:MAG: hypothetical protein SOZ48_09845 [Eubacterium sp.]|nr:hypothetical protein [Eubacterium sp.]
MTLCRKCGKEIPDGQELCEYCQNTSVELDEAYLDELMKSMEKSADEKKDTDEIPSEDMVLDDANLDEIMSEQSAEKEPAASAEEIPEEELLPELEFGKDLMEENEEVPIDDLPEEKENLETEAGSDSENKLISEQDLMTEELIAAEEPTLEPEIAEESEVAEEPALEPEIAEESEVTEEPAPEPEEEPALVEEPVLEEEPETEEMAEDDINHLLDMLSDDYEETRETEGKDNTDNPEMDAREIQEIATASLFSDDDSDNFFADGLEQEDTSGTTMDDVFQDALSAVEYSEKEESAEEGDPMALDPFGMEEEIPPNEEDDSAVTDIPEEKPPKTVKKPKKPKSQVSIWKRIFGNVITDQTAELEAKERAEELAGAEEKAKLKEEKKQQAEAQKAEKAEQAQAQKERKAAEKAEQAAAKAAEKEEKKRLKLEQEANEVVGKINPVGATIVMVFFGILCLFVIFGTQIFSYSRAVNKAEDNFMAGDYEEAYNSLAGVKVSESSEQMADQVRICMQLQKEINSYDNYYKMQMYLEALDSLMKGIRIYDLNKDKADEYGILNQFNALEQQIASLLYSEFGISETQARNINNTETQEAYTDKLEKIVNQWIAKIKEDER